MGPGASTSAALFVGQHQPPSPLLPSGHLLRHHQVLPNPPQSHVHLEEGVDGTKGRSNWLPKMNFPMFDGTNARI
jgi:hypothetical protein